jgi:ribosomal-protein-serine acetyltransferase
LISITEAQKDEFALKVLIPIFIKNHYTLLMKIIVDDNLSMEIITSQHAESIFNIANSNRDQLREWLPWVDKMKSIDFIIDFIVEAQICYFEKRDYAYVILYNNIVVGRIGIYKIDHLNKIGSIGYWLDEGHQGKGIITKACRELLNYGFNALDLNRIEIKCGTKNHKSQAIPKRLNFKEEGIVRQGELLYNKYIDLYSYSMLKEDWN